MNKLDLSHPDLSKYNHYLQSLIRNSINHKMVVFKDAHFLQPFPHDTGLVMINDKPKKNSSIVKILTDYNSSLKNSSFYFPLEMKKILKDKAWEAYEFLGAPKSSDDKWFFRKEIIPQEILESNDIKDAESAFCSDSSLSTEQMVELLEEVIILEDWPRIKEEWYDNVNKEFKSFYTQLNAMVCEERPYRIYVVGCDDASYSLVVATKEEAESVFNQITDNSTYATLKKLGFIFTN